MHMGHPYSPEMRLTRSRGLWLLACSKAEFESVWVVLDWTGDGRGMKDNQLT